MTKKSRWSWQLEIPGSIFQHEAPTVAPGETTWMTQGGMLAYGTSAVLMPELDTPPLLHYILPLTQEGQAHATASSGKYVFKLGFWQSIF